MAADRTARAPSFPFRRGPNGRVAMAEEDDLIAESVRQIVGTPKGTRVMRPTFGCDVFKRVFEPMDDVLRKLIEDDVRDALTTWESRIKVVGISTEVDRSRHKAVYTVTYDIVASRARRQYVGDIDLRS